MISRNALKYIIRVRYNVNCAKEYAKDASPVKHHKYGQWCADDARAYAKLSRKLGWTSGFPRGE